MVNIRAGPRGCDVALWATWQRHVGPRGLYYIYHLFILYIKEVFVLPYMGKVITLQIVGSYKPDDLSSFFSVWD